MADNQLSLAFTIESGEAVAGVEQVNTALEGTTAAATTATGAAKDTGAAISQGAGGAAADLAQLNFALGNTATAATTTSAAAAAIAPAIAPVVPAVDATTAAFDKMGQSQGIRGLTRSIVDAKMALEEFKASAAASGADVTAKMAQMQAAIDASTQKLGLYKKAMADTASQGAMMGSQLDALRTKAGSLTGMFDSMERTGTGATKMVGQLGLGIGIAGIAFAGAEMAGKKLSDMLVGLVDAISAMDQKQHQASDEANLFQNAMNAAAKGQIAYGNSLQETVANYKLFQAENTKSKGALEEFTKALKDIKPAADMQGVTADMVKFGEALHVAFNRGATDAALFLAAHKSTFAQITADWANAGQIAPDAILKINEALKQAEAAQKLLTDEGAKNVILSLTQITGARKVADDAAVTAAIHSQGRFEAEMKNLNQEVLTSEQYSARKKALYQQEADAETIAVDKQVLADAEAELAQAKLQKQLGLSSDAMKNLVAASGTYTTAVANGVQPSEALATASGALRLAIEATGAAVPKLSKALLDDLASGGMKKAADQTAAATVNQGQFVIAMEKTMAKAGEMGIVLQGLEAIVNKFGGSLDLTGIKLGNLADLMGTVVTSMR